MLDAGYSMLDTLMLVFNNEVRFNISNRNIILHQAANI